jgi:hypothetical protein
VQERRSVESVKRKGAKRRERKREGRNGLFVLDI